MAAAAMAKGRRRSPRRRSRSRSQGIAIASRLASAGFTARRSGGGVARSPRGPPRGPRARSPARAGREVQLGVRRLPEEEVGQALLAARADHELGVAQVGPVEEAGELGLAGVGAALGGEAARRVQDLLAAAVVHGDEQPQALVARREGLSLGDLGPQRLVEVPQRPMKRICTPLVELGHLAVDQLAEEAPSGRRPRRGRDQFSVENEKTVRSLMPASPAARDALERPRDGRRPPAGGGRGPSGRCRP